MRFGIIFLLAPEGSIGKPAALCLCKEPSGPWRCPGSRADAEFWGFAPAYQGGSAGLRQQSGGVCVCCGTPVLALHQCLSPTGASAAAPAGNRNETFTSPGASLACRTDPQQPFCVSLGAQTPGIWANSSKGVGTNLDIDAAFYRHPLHDVFFGTSCLEAVDTSQN